MYNIYYTVTDWKLHFYAYAEIKTESQKMVMSFGFYMCGHPCA